MRVERCLQSSRASSRMEHRKYPWAPSSRPRSEQLVSPEPWTEADHRAAVPQLGLVSGKPDPVRLGGRVTELCRLPGTLAARFAGGVILIDLQVANPPRGTAPPTAPLARWRLCQPQSRGSCSTPRHRSRTKKRQTVRPRHGMRHRRSSPMGCSRRSAAGSVHPHSQTSDE